MMKRVSLIWPLLIILIIFLGSMNTASALKCYEGDGKKGDKFDQIDCKKGPGPDPDAGSGIEVWCFKLTNGGKVTYGCAAKHPDEKEGCHEAKDYRGRTGTSCYCRTDGCNGSTPLGQMSLWLFFSLSIMVPWMSRALFAH